MGELGAIKQETIILEFEEDKIEDKPEIGLDKPLHGPSMGVFCTNSPLRLEVILIIGRQKAILSSQIALFSSENTFSSFLRTAGGDLTSTENCKEKMKKKKTENRNEKMRKYGNETLERNQKVTFGRTYSETLNVSFSLWLPLLKFNQYLDLANLI